jgi:hypothetical protein
MSIQNRNSHIYGSHHMFLIVLFVLFPGHIPHALAALDDTKPALHIMQPLEERGLRVIEGEVMEIQGTFEGEQFSHMKDSRYRVRTPSGYEWDLPLEEDTLVIGKIFLGDHIRAKVGMDGLPHIVQKVSMDTQQSKHPAERRRIKGTVERQDGNFLFVKNGERTEILHLDEQSTVEGDIREGNTVEAQLGDAGYVIRVKPYRRDSAATPE